MNVSAGSFSPHKSQNHATLKCHTCTAVFAAVFRAVLDVRTFEVLGGALGVQDFGFLFRFRRGFMYCCSDHKASLQVG